MRIMADMLFILLLFTSCFLCSSSRQERCHEVYRKPARKNVRIPEHQRNYSNNQNCDYKIMLNAPNTRIRLKFRDVQLQGRGKNGVCHDYLQVYDGLSHNSPVLKDKFCGNEATNQEIMSSSNEMRIKFVSDKTDTGRGFAFSYQSYEVCPDIVRQESSTMIKSPDYPQNYTRNLDCSYKIQFTKNTRIKLMFREVKLEKKNADGKCNDYIEVYDGFATWAPIIQKQFCGDGEGVVSQPIISSEYKMRVRFVTDGQISDKGFTLTYDPYKPRKVTDVTQKVTGVVIGTACGLVFLILTFLAICHSRHLTPLRRRGARRSEMALSSERDAIVEDGPPTYPEVMSSPPGKYPLTLIGPSKEDPPPRYSILVFASDESIGTNV